MQIQSITKQKVGPEAAHPLHMNACLVPCWVALAVDHFPRVPTNSPNLQFNSPQDLQMCPKWGTPKTALLSFGCSSTPSTWGSTSNCRQHAIFAFRSGVCMCLEQPTLPVQRDYIGCPPLSKQEKSHNFPSRVQGTYPAVQACIGGVYFPLFRF